MDECSTCSFIESVQECLTCDDKYTIMPECKICMDGYQLNVYSNKCELIVIIIEEPE